MKLRKIAAPVLALITALTLCACAAKVPAPAENNAETAPSAPPSEDPAPVAAPAEPVELIVFAAASMTETLSELGDKYMADNDGVKLIFSFESSGTLKTQIQEGADCDIFISAGQKQMNQLDINADPSVNTEGLDFILEGTRFNILENKVALAVPEGNPAGINSYDDLRDGLASGTVLLAMGNS
ncbi:MAG: substrate-binding domain-containing protein, partial [Oscillospiraceae bacterium]|nr:substrate-binding domain-containing protein [Oscillospiraceae bacterium]